MTLSWPWVLVAVPAGVAVLLTWWSRRTPARRAGDDAVLLARADLLRSLPRYRTQVRRRTALAVVHVAAAAVVCGGAALVLARPQTTEVSDPDATNRDVMLCLDASGSMRSFNVEVVRQVREIVGGLRGERIGLTLFSGSAVRVFPLTEDYDFVLDQLDTAERAFSGRGYFDYTLGTTSGNGLSLLSDGVVSCTQGFDRPEAERARALIVTSDNDPFGPPVFSLAEAERYAARRDVVVHVVASPRTKAGPARAAFEDVATGTGGTFTVLGEDGGSDRVVAGISSLEERRIDRPPTALVRDEPDAGSWVAAGGAAVLVGAWVVGGLLDRRRAGRRTRGVAG